MAKVKHSLAALLYDTFSGSTAGKWLAANSGAGGKARDALFHLVFDS